MSESKTLNRIAVTLTPKAGVDTLFLSEDHKDTTVDNGAVVQADLTNKKATVRALMNENGKAQWKWPAGYGEFVPFGMDGYTKAAGNGRQYGQPVSSISDTPNTSYCLPFYANDSYTSYIGVAPAEGKVYCAARPGATPVVKTLESFLNGSSNLSYMPVAIDGRLYLWFVCKVSGSYYNNWSAEKWDLSYVLWEDDTPKIEKVENVWKLTGAQGSWNRCFATVEELAFTFMFYVGFNTSPSVSPKLVRVYANSSSWLEAWQYSSDTEQAQKLSSLGFSESTRDEGICTWMTTGISVSSYTISDIRLYGIDDTDVTNQIESASVNFTTATGYAYLTLICRAKESAVSIEIKSWSCKIQRKTA